MKLQFYSVNALQPELDQEIINSFCSRHRLINIEKELVIQANHSYWAVCITYLEGASPSISPQKKRSSIDYREVLKEEEFAIYAELRELRKSLAETEAVPVYAIFSNAQLAEMVTKKVVSLAAMKQINGIGKAKLDLYANAFLNVLNKVFK